MPRRFTRAKLARLTSGEYNALSQDDRDAYDRALFAQWEDNSHHQIDGDYDQIGSLRRYQWGE